MIQVLRSLRFEALPYLDLKPASLARLQPSVLN